MTCGERLITATPGSFIYQPRGIVHGFKVEGDQPARLLQINTPTGLEHFFEEMGEPAKELTLPPPEPPNVEKMLALAAKYHLEEIRNSVVNDCRVLCDFRRRGHA